MMNDIELKLNNQGRGAFVLEENGQRQAEMEISIDGDILTVYHTQVSDALKGKGVARKLLDKMTGYARENNLGVKPLCSYVDTMFQRDPERYADLRSD